MRYDQEYMFNSILQQYIEKYPKFSVHNGPDGLRFQYGHVSEIVTYSIPFTNNLYELEQFIKHWISGASYKVNPYDVVQL